MTQIYNVPLTQDQRDYLLHLCKEVGDDDELAEQWLGVMGMDYLETALRDAQPAQSDALQRLEEWQEDATQTRAYSVQVGKGVYVVWLYVKGHRIGKSIAPTLADAINAALGAAEGAENE